MRVRVVGPGSSLLSAEEATAPLEERGVLELHGAPAALVTELASRGYTIDREPLGAAGVEIVRAAKGPVPPLVDLTGLEAPEPMHRILLAFAQLQPGGVFLALLPHRPGPLFPHLDARRASYEVALRPDGKALLWLSR